MTGRLDVICPSPCGMGITRLLAVFLAVGMCPPQKWGSSDLRITITIITIDSKLRNDHASLTDMDKIVSSKMTLRGINCLGEDRRECLSWR